MTREFTSESTCALAGKRICVTGGTGFLGRSAVRQLADRGCKDVIVARKADFDLVQVDAVQRLYDTLKPQVVFHLAAVVGGIGANSRNPGRFFYENLMMGAHLIEGARVHGVEKFIQVGTVCAYPKNTSAPFREDDLWNGYPEETNAPYGVAKKALLVQCQTYRTQYGLNAIYLLPVNLYGPGDNFDSESSHVIPALIKKCVDAVDQATPEIQVWGSGEPTREFLYVDDAAEALILAAEQYDGREPVNIGSGKEISIRSLVALIAELTGYNGKIVWDPTKPDGQPRRLLDVSRAERLFGFRAKTDFKEGLRRTIAWYRQTKLKQSCQAGV